MKKRNITTIVLIIAMIAAICLAGCSKGQTDPQEDDKQAASQGGHAAYGFAYDMPETEWIYMFNAEQIGTGDEWIDLEISGYGEKPSVPKDSNKKSIDGRECYWYDMEDDGLSKFIIIPLAGGKKFIEIKSEFIEYEDKDKADALYENILDGIKFTDDEGYIACKDHISVGGVEIPAKGLKPVQFFYGMLDLEATDGLISLQIDFDDENYSKGVEKAFDELDWNEFGRLLDDGSVEISGIKSKWYTCLDIVPESLTYMNYVLMIPNDDMKTIMRFEYNFDGEVDDLSRYDNMIKELTENISAVETSE